MKPTTPIFGSPFGKSNTVQKQFGILESIQDQTARWSRTQADGSIIKTMVYKNNLLPTTRKAIALEGIAYPTESLVYSTGLHGVPFGTENGDGFGENFEHVLFNKLSSSTWIATRPDVLTGNVYHTNSDGYTVSWQWGDVSETLSNALIYAQDEDVFAAGLTEDSQIIYHRGLILKSMPSGYSCIGAMIQDGWLFAAGINKDEIVYGIVGKSAYNMVGYPSYWDTFYSYNNFGPAAVGDTVTINGNERTITAASYGGFYTYILNEPIIGGWLKYADMLGFFAQPTFGIFCIPLNTSKEDYTTEEGAEWNNIYSNSDVDWVQQMRSPADSAKFIGVHANTSDNRTVYEFVIDTANTPLPSVTRSSKKTTKYWEDMQLTITGAQALSDGCERVIDINGGEFDWTYSSTSCSGTQCPPSTGQPPTPFTVSDCVGFVSSYNYEYELKIAEYLQFTREYAEADVTKLDMILGADYNLENELVIATLKWDLLSENEYYNSVVNHETISNYTFHGITVRGSFTQVPEAQDCSGVIENLLACNFTRTGVPSPGQISVSYNQTIASYREGHVTGSINFNCGLYINDEEVIPLCNLDEEVTNSFTCGDSSDCGSDTYYKERPWRSFNTTSTSCNGYTTPDRWEPSTTTSNVYVGSTGNFTWCYDMVLNDIGDTEYDDLVFPINRSISKLTYMNLKDGVYVYTTRSGSLIDDFIVMAPYSIAEQTNPTTPTIQYKGSLFIPHLDVLEETETDPVIELIVATGLDLKLGVGNNISFLDTNTVYDFSGKHKDLTENENASASIDEGILTSVRQPLDDPDETHLLATKLWNPERDSFDLLHISDPEPQYGTVSVL